MSARKGGMRVGELVCVERIAPEPPAAFKGSLLDGLTLDALEAEVTRSRAVARREATSSVVILGAIQQKERWLQRAVDRGYDSDDVKQYAIELAALALRFAEER